jgi:hypothetical protein
MKVTPSSVSLGYIVPKSKFPHIAKIQTEKTPKGTPYITTSSPHLKAFLHNNVENNIIGIDLEIAGNAPRGKLKEYVYVKTGVRSRPNVIIAVSGVVEQGIRARPEVVFFNVIKREQILSRTIRLQVIDPSWKTVKVEPVEQQYIQVNLQQLDEDNFELQVSLYSSKMPAVLDFPITLRNEHGDAMLLPLLAVCRIKAPTVSP